jgi:RNA polymerase-binding transcription factor DksA
MDFCDDALALTERETAAAISAVTGRRRGQGPEWVDGAPRCRECGGPIPPARVEALGLDAERCVRCAE